MIVILIPVDHDARLYGYRKRRSGNLKCEVAICTDIHVDLISSIPPHRPESLVQKSENMDNDESFTYSVDFNVLYKIISQSARNSDAFGHLLGIHCNMVSGEALLFALG